MEGVPRFCVGGSPFEGSVTTSCFFFTLKTWPHDVHLTVTPSSVTRASSSSYSVWHLGQPTSMFHAP